LLRGGERRQGRADRSEGDTISEGDGLFVELSGRDSVAFGVDNFPDGLRIGNRVWAEMGDLSFYCQRLVGGIDELTHSGQRDGDMQKRETVRG
jgi:hypothetical protein